MSCVLALHEILHEAKKKGQIGVILKLDFEKVYDKVYWFFLLDALEREALMRLGALGSVKY
jgi:hypothetical protein